MNKKIFLSLLPLAFLAGNLTSCNSNIYKIGILQPIKHEALNAARLGFVKALEDKGLVENKDFKIIYRNAGGKEADQNSYAKDLVSRCNMTLGIGTGAAQALKAASVDQGVTNPLLFTAVTDPVNASLVTSLENGSGFVTGTSDAQPVDAQIDLIQQCIPGVDKIGILYTQTETNSIVQKDQAIAAATLKSIQVVTQSVSQASDISSAALALADETGIDAFYIPTDNNLAANMSAIKDAANAQNILIVTGEENMMKSGGHITLSVDYTELGKVTGNMAYEIMKNGKQAKDIAVVTMKKEDCAYKCCTANLVGSSFSIPKEVLDLCEDIPLN